jgi:hypothetical protein
MMKDRDLKEKALIYTVRKGWFPQLETNVLFRDRISKTPKNITDIDVMGLSPDDFLAYRMILMDCKTGKDSPITRALWQRGLMEQVKAQEGICIFRKNAIEPDHRYTAARLNVLLFTEKEFEKFLSANGIVNLQPSCNLEMLSLWQKYFDIPVQFPALIDLINFSRVEYWNCEGESESCRKTISILRRYAPKLDPAQPSHIAVVADLTSLFLLSVARIVNKIFAEYLQPEKKEDLANALKIMLYGGREAYEFRLMLFQQAINAKSGSDSKSQRELTLPLWDEYVQLIRQSLDAPFELLRSPMLLREIGWDHLSDKSNLNFAKTLTKQFPQAARLAIIGANYLCKATKLPNEFSEIITNDVLNTPKS